MELQLNLPYIGIDMTQYNSLFKEISEFDKLFSPELFLEALDAPNTGMKETMREVHRNTKETVKDTAHVYGDLTDAGGSMMKATWDMFIKAVALASKVIKFIFNNLARIPTMIAAVIQKIGSIPSEVRALIRGDLKIYLTPRDLQVMNHNVLGDIKVYLSHASELSKGKFFTTLMGTRGRDFRDLVFGENDMKHYKKMKAKYNKLSSVGITPTHIQMTDETREIYFGKGPAVKIPVKGSIKNLTYLDALNTTITEISGLQGSLRTVEELIQKKIQMTYDNNSITKLSRGQQRDVQDSVVMTSKVINLIGNFMKYIIHDVDLINKTTAKVTAYMSKKTPPKK